MKVLLLLLGMLFASCMHVGMPMMNGSSQDDQKDPIIEKEVTFGQIKAVATFPPMAAGEEQVFTLKLTNAATQEPVTGAEGYFHAEFVRSADSSSRDASTYGAQNVHDINVTRDLVESNDEPGTYTVSYGSSTPGAQDLMFHITSVDKQKLDPEFVVATRRSVSDAPSGSRHGGMMMGSGPSATTYLIIGSAIMAAMMTFMIIRGRMF